MRRGNVVLVFLCILFFFRPRLLKNSFEIQFFVREVDGRLLAFVQFLFIRFVCPSKCHSVNIDAQPENQMRINSNPSSNSKCNSAIGMWTTHTHSQRRAGRVKKTTKQTRWENGIRKLVFSWFWCHVLFRRLLFSFFFRLHIFSSVKYFRGFMSTALVRVFFIDWEKKGQQKSEKNRNFSW